MRQSRENVTEQAGRYREHNFCTVSAVACAFDISSGRAHRLLKRHANRPFRDGPRSSMFHEAVEKIAEAEGKRVEHYDRLRGETLNQFHKRYASRGGKWIVCIKGHAIGFNEGESTDWTSDETGRNLVRRKTAKLGYRATTVAFQIID